MIVNHKTYGRMEVSAEDLATSDAFIWAKPVTRTGDPIYVGKAALDDQGGYVPKKRADADRITKYLPLVYAAAATMCREQDDYDEVWCEGALGLVEADARYNEHSNAAFASFAKPYVSGYILNMQNPQRNGQMNMVQGYAGIGVSNQETTEAKHQMGQIYEAFQDLTPKQRYVMRGLYELGLTQEQVAERMGLERTSVRDLHARATVAIREHLGLNTTQNEKVCGGGTPKS
jgi:RNA polymerase sigma factor (sigma-70 family)